MNQEEANIEAKKIFDTWQKKKKEIEKDAKEKGRWNKGGLDSNNHLFKNIDEECVSVIYKRKDDNYGIINMK